MRGLYLRHIENRQERGKGGSHYCCLIMMRGVGGGGAAKSNENKKDRRREPESVVINDFHAKIGGLEKKVLSSYSNNLLRLRFLQTISADSLFCFIE